MIKDIIQSYYDFFDTKLKKNNTVVVVMISVMVFSVWLLSPNASKAYLKTNILENNSNYENQTIVIDGIKYKLVLDN